MRWGLAILPRAECGNCGAAIHPADWTRCSNCLRPVPAHRRVNIDPRKLSRTDRVIAWCLGIRFKGKGL